MKTVREREKDNVREAHLHFKSGNNEYAAWCSSGMFYPTTVCSIRMCVCRMIAGFRKLFQSVFVLEPSFTIAFLRQMGCW